MPHPQKYTSKLHSARILVIGGTAGIGYACAEALLENGAAEVVVSSSREEKVKGAVERLKETYPSSGAVSGHACNLKPTENPSSQLEGNIVMLLDAATEGNTKKLDHIIFTAGDSLSISPLTSTTYDFILSAGTVRFFAPLLLAKHAKAHMNPGPASSLVFTSGSAGDRPLPDWPVICAFAAGMEGMVKALALDLAPLRVNLVSPGAVDTDLLGLTEGSKQGFLEAVAQKSATGCIGKVEDLAEAYLYAVRDWNATGSVVRSNSGGLLK